MRSKAVEQEKAAHVPVICQAIEPYGSLEDFDAAMTFPFAVRCLMTLAWAHGQIGESERAGKILQSLDRKFREIDAENDWVAQVDAARAALQVEVNPSKEE